MKNNESEVKGEFAFAKLVEALRRLYGKVHIICNFLYIALQKVVKVRYGSTLHCALAFI